MTASGGHLYRVTPPAKRRAILDEVFRAKNAHPIQSADDLA
jgi:hypothetical protein